MSKSDYIELEGVVKEKLPNTTFKEQQQYRSEYQRLSNLVLLEIGKSIQL